MLDAKKLFYHNQKNLVIVSTQEIKITEQEKEEENNISINIAENTQASIYYSLKKKENKIHIKLEKESKVDLTCTCTNEKDKETKGKIIIQHQGSKSLSSMNIKGVAKDKSKINFLGKIIIDEEAENCEGYQDINVLMIGEEAKGKATPKLAIHNSKVICNHGASVGGINKEQLFYLQSRGLSEEEAEKNIIKGYLSNAGKNIQNKELYNLLQEQIITKKEKKEGE